MGTLENNNISFDLPISQSNTIKVIGVGGGGSNAVNHMFQQSIRGVDFVICNTDAQALDNSSIPNKIQLGAELTSGLGAGANPEVGKQAAEESLQELQQMLSNQTKMVFITAGMGGGTGTGAAPIIAKLAKDMEVLTVGIVTMPFQFEGKSRMMQAKKGIEMLREQVDSLIVINNNKLREVYGNLGFKAGFSKADEVLSTAAKGIAEVITHHYKQNIDLNDAKRVLSNSGTAIMGSSKESGTDRAQVAIKKALDSPLLNDNKITGAKNVLLLIVSGTTEVTIDEIGDINDFIQTEAGFDANIIMGVGEDESLEDSIAITVVATGFATDQQNEMSSGEQRKVVHVLESEQKATYEFEEPKNNIIDTPKVRVEVPKVPEKIVHELVEEEEVPKVNIMDVEVVDFRIVEAVPEPEVLTIDFPEETAANPFEMEVIDPVEIKADVEAPTVVFTLDDFDDTEEIKKDFSSVAPTIGKSSTISSEKFKRTLDIEDEDLQIEIKTKPVAVEEIEVKDHQEISPLHMSIEQLRQTADDRKSKLKKFNYSFRSGQQHIDDIEKEPAYKRQGVELNSRPGELNSSRTSIDLDENDQPKLRSNNSFLHDNVD